MSESHEDGELRRANSGAVRFQVKCLSGLADVTLCSVNPPHKELYVIHLGNCSTIEPLRNCNEIFERIQAVSIDFTMQHQEFWITWSGSEILVGFGDQTNPFMRHSYVRDKDEMIGYIKFLKNQDRTISAHTTDWIYEESPINLIPINLKKINSGDLRWVSLNTKIDYQVPADALIGGFEKEPLYIARAEHNGSMCPGKYVVSQRKAFVPWGGREHQKTQIEILCGYNATWVKTKGDRIPQNAFIGGISEVRREPLYIGRAEHDGCLITGKIHIIYQTCYLPYYGKEIEVYSFEILVVPELNYRGILPDADAACCNVNLPTPLEDRHERFFF